MLHLFFTKETKTLSTAHIQMLETKFYFTVAKTALILYKGIEYS